LVIVNGVVSTHTLPESGEITIGRARESDVQVIDASVSRMHAKIRVGPPVTIEDLASANGTRVRGALIEPSRPTDVVLGEVMELGSALVMVQQRPIATREWRIWAHGYFEGRLEDECARATRSGGTFGLVRIRTSAPPREGDLVQQVLANTLRTDDVVGLYGPGDYEVLLVERTEDEISSVVSVLEKAFDDVGISARVATALFPRDGRNADALEAKAGSTARGVVAEEHPAGPLVLRSQVMRKLYELLDRVAPGDITVLIMGDTGVGKEVMAEQVHKLSPRAKKPFLRLNCAALSESLLESELFGHERGAFTGAHQVKAGLLETAQGGTVFLDEIGELPMSVQVKLLRVLEERQVWRVGGVKPRPIDVRFVAATNRDLEIAVTEHKFRQDLYFRLAGVTLHIPPLRERGEEIEPLAREFIQQLSRGRVPHTLTGDVVQLMLGYSWPGNIRELRNAIERAVLLAGDGPILPEHFPVEKMTATVSTPISEPPAPQSLSRAVGRPQSGDRLPAHTHHETLIPPPDDDEDLTDELSLGERLKRQVQEVERQHIIDALTRCGGNQTRAARELGISRRTLISRLEAYNIPRPLKDRHLDD
ncbi:MAG TPA: sigma 54-interacting transcriptional regulator, partial [Polyangiales bacterium]|nr:sigma 54-interacting transcriptional regulator [Polyangiales bacterium]